MKNLTAMITTRIYPAKLTLYIQTNGATVAAAQIAICIQLGPTQIFR
jgi:hypothetical protein